MVLGVHLRPGVIQHMGDSATLFFGGVSDLPVDGKSIENALWAADTDAEYSKDIETSKGYTLEGTENIENDIEGINRYEAIRVWRAYQ